MVGHVDLAGREFLQVDARAERSPLAGDDDDAHALVRGERVCGRVQVQRALVAKRIQPLGAVDVQRRQRAVIGDKHRWQLHRSCVETPQVYPERSRRSASLHYCPLQFGLRFSTNALIPSFWSSVLKSSENS